MKKIIFILLIIIFSMPMQSYASHGWLLYFERPFKGRVYDARTKKPIDGAVVVIINNIRLCGPLFVPECGTDAVSYAESVTKNDGSFLIYPHFFIHPWPFTLGGEESDLIVFKPGYKVLTSRGSFHGNEIALEPIPLTYYPRYEELEKVKDTYGLDWRETRHLKNIIAKEENALRTFERYPDGVIFHAFTNEPNALISPEDIAVDKNYIYVGDGFADMRVHFLNINGSYLGKEPFVVGDMSGGVVSGGDIALALKDEDRVLGFAHNCLKEFSLNHKYQYWGGKPVYCYRAKGYFPYDLKRFKMGKDGNIYAITKVFSISSPSSFLIINKDGEILHKYEGGPFFDISLDSDGYSYVSSSLGIIKFNKNAEPVKKMEVDVDVYTELRNITVDGKGIIYFAFKDRINAYDSDLNKIGSLNIKSPSLGEINIEAIAVDDEGNYLYAIDRKYNRILKYDLKNKKWAPKLN